MTPVTPRAHKPHKMVSTTHQSKNEHNLKPTFKVVQTAHTTNHIDLRTCSTRRSFWIRLGGYNSCILITGTLAIIIAIFFLAYVWDGAKVVAEVEQGPQFWRRIVQTEWTVRIVTLASVVVRIATGAQLGVFAALVAALMLEVDGVHPTDFALLSMVRCLNTGPQVFLRNMGRAFRTGSQFGPAILVAAALLNAIALQFTSTILLTDFGNTPVIFESRSSNLSYSVKFNPDGLDVTRRNGIDFWKSGIGVLPRFAEYHEPGALNESMADTGRTYRGFLPFSSPEERETLREFNGMMTVVDSRVVCVKPSFSNFSVDWRPPFLGVANLVLGWNNSSPIFSEGYGAFTNTSNPFRCSLVIPFQDGENKHENHPWRLSLCGLANIIPLIDGIQTDTNLFIASYAETYLLFNTTGSRNDWRYTFNKNGTELKERDVPGPWHSTHAGNVSVDATLCVHNPRPWNYDVRISAENDVKEPTLGWRNTTGQYETLDIRKALDATSTSRPAGDRGLLTIQPHENWTEVAEKDLESHQNFVWTALAQGFNSWNAGENSTDTAVLDPSTSASSIHRTLAYITQDILRDTSNPALALQGLFTMLMQMAYYDYLPQFDATSPTTYRFSSIALIPQQWKGFGIVMGLLTLHFILLTIALVLFLARTELSLLGNAWQSVAQVVSDDTAEVMHHASVLTDREIRKLTKKSDIAEGKIQIRKAVETGRVEAVYQGAVKRREGYAYAVPEEEDTRYVGMAI